MGYTLRLPRQCVLFRNDIKRECIYIGQSMFSDFAKFTLPMGCSSTKRSLVNNFVRKIFSPTKLK